ncbi:MAG: hypothetical protein HYR85_10465 [Planctomycetes bacterium]|nr:hypothetical protein [Planctomycetota bacterium]MBI3845107.1 hypothetical protein [Planctomycetota bacterium]
MKTILLAIAIPGAIIALPRQDAKPPVDSAVDAERAQNVAAYETAYLSQKELLVADHVGEWAAIVGGELLAPFPTMAACIDAADKKQPRALHRFVFRIGEEGDVRFKSIAGIWLGQPRNAISLNFVLADEHLIVDFAGPGADMTWGHAGKTTKVHWDEKNFIELDLADPTGTKRERVPLILSGRFNETVGLDPTVAAKLGLERFEIPGRGFSKDILVGGQPFECRRARVRIHMPEIDYDETFSMVIFPPASSASGK